MIYHELISQPVPCLIVPFADDHRFIAAIQQHGIIILIEHGLHLVDLLLIGQGAHQLYIGKSAGRLQPVDYPGTQQIRSLSHTAYKGPVAIIISLLYMEVEHTYQPLHRGAVDISAIRKILAAVTCEAAGTAFITDEAVYICIFDVSQKMLLPFR